MITRIILDNHDRSGFLELPALRAAALALVEKVLVDISRQEVNKHSHMATHYFLAHRGLQKKYKQNGTSPHNQKESQGKRREPVTSVWRGRVAAAPLWRGEDLLLWGLV